MPRLTHQRSWVLAAALVAIGGCASQTPCAVRNVDGFYASCTETTLKEAYLPDMVLPMAEQDFLAAIAPLGFRLSYEGRPADGCCGMPIPQEAKHLREADIDHAIWLIRDQDRSNHFARFVAYVVDGQVVAVENESGAYTPFA